MNIEITKVVIRWPRRLRKGIMRWQGEPMPPLFGPSFKSQSWNLTSKNLEISFNKKKD
jgi:hypothetical protein